MLAPLGATKTAVPCPIWSLARSAVDPRLAAPSSDPFRKTLKVSAPETVWSLIRTDQSVPNFRVSCLVPPVPLMLNHQPLRQPTAIPLAAAARSYHRLGRASCRPRPTVAQRSLRGRVLRCRPKKFASVVSKLNTAACPCLRQKTRPAACPA